MPGTVNVLFVCLGNICRSPMAEGVFRARLAEAGLAARVGVDSAGTGAWHAGEPPDPRAQACARRRGYDIAGLRARQVVATDFQAFDFILAMDDDNLADLRRLAPPALRDRPRLLLEHAPSARVRHVPDPYQGGIEGFERVLDLVEEACAGLLVTVRERVA